jgi:hypothetical protein
MRADAALRLVRQMARYKTTAKGPGFVWRLHPQGNYVRQVLIPFATAAQIHYAADVADVSRTRETNDEWLPVSALLSEQHRLSPRSLAYQIPRFFTMQKRKLPTVIPLPSGKYLIWDGNHRCSAAILLGVTHMRCELMRKSRSAH